MPCHGAAGAGGRGGLRRSRCQMLTRARTDSDTSGPGRRRVIRFRFKLEKNGVCIDSSKSTKFEALFAHSSLLGALGAGADTPTAATPLAHRSPSPLASGWLRRRGTRAGVILRSGSNCASPLARGGPAILLKKVQRGPGRREVLANRQVQVWAVGRRAVGRLPSGLSRGPTGEMRGKTARGCRSNSGGHDARFGLIPRLSDWLHARLTRHRPVSHQPWAGGRLALDQTSTSRRLVDVWSSARVTSQTAAERVQRAPPAAWRLAPHSARARACRSCSG